MSTCAVPGTQALTLALFCPAEDFDFDVRVGASEPNVRRPYGDAVKVLVLRGLSVRAARNQDTLRLLIPLHDDPREYVVICFA